MASNAPEIAYRKIEDIKPYSNTPRIHSRAQRRKMTAVLRRFGQIVPIIVDSESVIVDGHLVAEVWKELGNDEIATVVVSNRDPAEVRALRLALNRLSEEAKWDNSRLGREFSELLEIGFDMALTGFDQVEIDMSLSIDDPSSAGVEDAPTLNPNALAVSQQGDLWLLYKERQENCHRVICGDARSAATLATLAGSEQAQMMFTDPPFNVKIGGNVSGLGSSQHREFAMASGEMDRRQFTKFLADFLQCCREILAEGAVIYACMDWRHLPELFSATEAAEFTLLNMCVWAKTNAGMGTFYRSQHELVLVSKKGTAPHINNFELGKKGRSRSNLWTYRGMNVVGKERDELLKLHPTVKPVALVVDAIKDVSRRNGIVLDPFLGSGTTLVAAEETGRRCFGVEYDPAYVDLAIRRWIDHSGGTAIHAETGESFTAIEARLIAEAASTSSETVA